MRNDVITVRAHVRTDGLIDVTDIDGVVLTTIENKTWLEQLVKIEVNGKEGFVFKKNGINVFTVKKTIKDIPSID